MSGPFSVGDRVEWTSQSAGVVRRKEGEVVQVVPPRGDPVGVRNPGEERDHLSYVVRVKGRGLYWPRVAGLRWASSDPAPSHAVAFPLAGREGSAPSLSKSAVSVSESGVPGGRRTGGERAP